MTDHRPHAVTLAQFSSVFILFGVLVVAALIWPEVTDALNLNRTKATIWATSVLLDFALIVYPFRSISVASNNLAALLWTFAWLAFLAHAYWAIFIIFNGVTDTFRQMGLAIAGTNFLLTILWSLDVGLLWTIRRELRWLDVAHTVVRIFAFIIFAATLLILRGGSARVLGIVFTSTVVVALAVRVFAQAKSTNTLRPVS